ncbi:unnamed protein product [Phytomonas sp. EM1]|nr:unnamed protein product [Phytomonas sp. EM1]|eukprot:CCW61324.1 unnamed protein product [Phytomonas sp. isolate EM1]
MHNYLSAYQAHILFFLNIMNIESPVLLSFCFTNLFPHSHSNFSHASRTIVWVSLMPIFSHHFIVVFDLYAFHPFFFEAEGSKS